MKDGKKVKRNLWEVGYWVLGDEGFIYLLRPDEYGEDEERVIAQLSISTIEANDFVVVNG